MTNMGNIRSRDEQRKWCREQMRDHDNESIEWWQANAWLQQDEKIKISICMWK